ncbi:unnamed protein product [Dicrocoelium dendriticum]|nr:unnamed protein product [Dicrocoelium dendriticum]
MTAASDTDVETAVQQLVDNRWIPLGFFSTRLQPAESRYSTFDREILAIYLVIRHFRHYLGRHFAVFTDYKPLIYAINGATDKYSPRETRHLNYVSQFKTDVRHISDDINPVADALSRINQISLALGASIDLDAMAAAQQVGPDIGKPRRNTSDSPVQRLPPQPGPSRPTPQSQTSHSASAEPTATTDLTHTIKRRGRGIKPREFLRLC